MKNFKELITVAKKLNDPETGCPWDIKQTFSSLQKFILEESFELVEAVDSENDKEILEELGDVLYVVIFYCMVAMRENRFTLDEVLQAQKEKLVRRHPHVFGDKKVKSADEVNAIWQEVKKEEKPERQSIFEGIPKSLHALARAQKMLSKLIDHEYEVLEKIQGEENDLGRKLLHLVYQAEQEGLDAEKSLREALKMIEKRMSNEK